jgi:hypothetical protein
MTLELHKVATQVREMGHSLAEQSTLRLEAIAEAQALLRQYSTAYTDLFDRISRAEKIQQKQRFDWVGAAPTAEALAEAHPLPDCPDQLTIIASDGSQILPDPHAITLYYLINVGSIVYRHGSSLKPKTYHPQPLLCYSPEDILDEQGRLISSAEVNVKRDLAELRTLTELAAREATPTEPLVTLLDGQLTLRVIDLPFHQQESHQNEYLEMLNELRERGALVAAYIDRPRSTFVLALLYLASLALADLSEETLRHNRFRHLTDLEVFDFLAPGERSAVFATKAKGLEKYDYSGHGVHFFYLNVSNTPLDPHLARIEIPAWIAANPPALNILHTAIVRQARLTGGYPYVLARADELAVISTEEREAVETMLAVEMRRQGLTPAISLKQNSKNAFRARKESFRL